MSRVKVLFALLILTFAPAALAQVDCPAIVRAALDAVDAACSTTARNQVCYGNIQLKATPQDGKTLVFEKSGDIVNVADLHALQLSSMSLDDSSWGVALMKLQANLPDTLPGQNVTLLLFGDVEMTSAQAAPIELTMTARRGVNVRLRPTTQGSQVLATLKAGDTIIADGRLKDGSWVRVKLDKGVGWVSADFLKTAGDVSQLAIVEEGARAFGPLQAFYFKSGVGDRPCDEAPDSGILVQSPQGAGRIAFTVDEVAITLGSTAYLQAGGGYLIVSVVEGQATVTAFNTTVTLPAGTRARVPLDTSLRATSAPIGPEPYNATALTTLPVQHLPAVVPIAAPLPVDQIAALAAVVPLSGNWCPTATGCTNGISPTTIRFTSEENGAFLTLDYGDGAERYTRVEAGSYIWTDGSTQAVLQVLSPSHFTLDFTFAGGRTTRQDWTLLTAD